MRNKEILQNEWNMEKFEIYSMDKPIGHRKLIMISSIIPGKKLTVKHITGIVS